MNNWPDDTHIINVAMNGECDQPVYEIGETLYRVNPVGGYALYWNGRKWGESAAVTNDMILTGQSSQAAD